MTRQPYAIQDGPILYGMVLIVEPGESRSEIHPHRLPDGRYATGAIRHTNVPTEQNSIVYTRDQIRGLVDAAIPGTVKR